MIGFQNLYFWFIGNIIIILAYIIPVVLNNHVKNEAQIETLLRSMTLGKFLNYYKLNSVVSLWALSEIKNVKRLLLYLAYNTLSIKLGSLVVVSIGIIQLFWI